LALRYHGDFVDGYPSDPDFLERVVVPAAGVFTFPAFPQGVKASGQETMDTTAEVSTFSTVAQGVTAIAACIAMVHLAIP